MRRRQRYLRERIAVEEGSISVEPGFARRCRDLHDERGTTEFAVGDRDSSMVIRGDICDDRETETGATDVTAQRGVESHESLEHRAALIGRDSRPVIAHDDTNDAVVGGNVHGDALMCVLFGVVQEVSHHSPQLICVTRDDRRHAGSMCGHRDVAAADRPDRLADDAAEIDWLGRWALMGVEAGQEQQKSSRQRAVVARPRSHEITFKANWRR
jgi:hypothetical protein